MKEINSLIRFPAFIAGRYLLSRGEPRFVSFLTFVAVLGVAVGLSSLIVVISVMVGFGKDLESKLMGFNPHITIESSYENLDGLAKKIEAELGDIGHVEEFITGEAIVQVRSSGEMSAIGAKILGFDRIPDRMFDTAKFYWGGGLAGKVWWHDFISPIREGVVLGNEMIYQIGVHPDFGDSVQLISPFGGIDPLGNPIPKRREYNLAGGFKSGFFEYDIKYAIMSYDEAMRLLGTQGRRGLQIMLKNASRVPSVVAKLGSSLGPSYRVSSWTEKNKRLFAALKLEKIAMTFILSLIIVIASFSIIGVVLMIFFSKRKDLAVLMAIGASRKSIEKIFLFNGAFIGFAGAFLGSVAGLAILLFIKQSHIVLPPSYYLDYLPVHINGWLIFVIAVGGILISLLAAFYPARRAAMTDPIELLRCE